MSRIQSVDFTSFSFAVIRREDGKIEVIVCDGTTKEEARKSLEEMGAPLPETVAFIGPSLTSEEMLRAYALLSLLVDESYESGEGLVNILCHFISEAFMAGFAEGQKVKR